MATTTTGLCLLSLLLTRMASKSRNGIATAPVIDLFLSNLQKIYSRKTKKTTHLVIRIPNAFILNNIFFFLRCFTLMYTQ